MMTSGTLQAQEQAEATMKQAHTSFYWPMRLLPRDKRDAMYAIYAFCRIVDDIADEPGLAGDKRDNLQLWRQEITNIFEDKPSVPVGQSLAVARSRFTLRKQDFLDIIDGMEMDVGVELGKGHSEAQVRITDLAELDIYCDRVAGAVGRLSNQVFGLDGDGGEALAKTLGRALQLTNILRDLREDAGIDRLYLPLDMLKRHGIEETEPLAVLKSAALPKVCDDLVAMAAENFKEAETMISGFDRARARPAIIMMAIYQRVLQRLIQRGWRDLEKPVRLSRLSRLWIAVRSGVLGL
jgi:presqualene diphosphate synthase